MNALLELAKLGQSLWLDSLGRELLDSGTIARMIREDGLAGVTSNPSIFQKSIGDGGAYAAEIERLRARRPGIGAFDVYEALAVRDVRDAADLLLPVHRRTDGRDGFVSLEVTLHGGRGASDVLGEARHLWRLVDRPNVMIKVPGTPEGIEAFRQLIAEGIHVNVTLLFSRAVYEAVARAYVEGLEARARAGGDVSRAASVASFFVSRIDTAVDARLEAAAKALSGAERERALDLRGKAAIANAKLAYRLAGEVFAGPRWQELAARGAHPQRLLWASTSTKNPAYRDVVYVEELIGADTVDTAPLETIAAFKDHGSARPTLAQGVDEARKELDALAALGVSLDEVTAELLEKGLRSFDDAFTGLLGAIAKRLAPAKAVAPTTWTLGAQLEGQLAPLLAEWGRPGGGIERLWKRDATLWTDGDEAKWLGWLDAPERGLGARAELEAFAAEVRAEGCSHVLLLGMGGSSLAPEVLAKTFGSRKGHPELLVLDSTDPAQVAALEARTDPARTLYVVASKSGSTLEPTLFEEYFFARAAAKPGGEKAAAKRFVAITDPGSKLEATARAKGWRRVFHGDPSIGGRFSALSMFGLVPAALLGIDLERFLGRAAEVARGCRAAPDENCGVSLGLILGLAAEVGRDKLTLVLSPRLAALGPWLEQLVAESTGKQRKGIIPIDGEAVGIPQVYGRDRLFVYVRDLGAPDAAQDKAVDALERAGHPVVRLLVEHPLDLGGEFFRWEIATAVAGSVLKIHPFDQPDVEASKIATRGLTEEFEKKGSLPAETPFFAEDGIELYADQRNADELRRRAGRDPSLAELFGAHLARPAAGDYFAILAYLPMTAENERTLSDLRAMVRDNVRVATAVGFGPRFLHSTGQAYKGGPNSGVFLQLTCEHARDLAIPGRKATFGIVETAQARGDLAVLQERGRRFLRVHLRCPLDAGLARLAHAAGQALAQRLEFTG